MSKPSSERFFQEIHTRFHEAEVEIKNSPMGLVVSHEVCGQRRRGEKREMGESERVRERERERERVSV